MKMRNVLLTIGIGIIALSSCNSQNKKSKDKMELETEIDSVSYALGVNLGSNVKKSGMEEINTDAFGAAATAILAGEELKMTEEEAMKVLNDYFGAIQMRKAEAATAEGRTWLAENAKKEGVTTTASGLQYSIIESGSGATPSLTDQVTTHYTGKLIDGTTFDSSVERGQPATFPVNGVIVGWTEALQLMKEGDKWKLYIPSELAYGERSPSPAIPANSVLIFDIELISVNK